VTSAGHGGRTSGWPRPQGCRSRRSQPVEVDGRGSAGAQPTTHDCGLVEKGGWLAIPPVGGSTQLRSFPSGVREAWIEPNVSLSAVDNIRRKQLCLGHITADPFSSKLCLYVMVGGGFVAKGASDKELAALVGLSVATVRTQMRFLCRDRPTAAEEVGVLLPDGLRLIHGLLRRLGSTSGLDHCHAALSVAVGSHSS
jgi:hypothetical protein